MSIKLKPGCIFAKVMGREKSLFMLRHILLCSFLILFAANLHAQTSDIKEEETEDFEEVDNKHIYDFANVIDDEQEKAMEDTINSSYPYNISIFTVDELGDTTTHPYNYYFEEFIGNSTYLDGFDDLIILIKVKNGSEPAMTFVKVCFLENRSREEVFSIIQNKMKPFLEREDYAAGTWAAIDYYINSADFIHYCGMATPALILDDLLFSPINSLSYFASYVYSSAAYIFELSKNNPSSTFKILILYIFLPLMIIFLLIYTLIIIIRKKELKDKQLERSLSVPPPFNPDNHYDGDVK